MMKAWLFFVVPLLADSVFSVHHNLCIGPGCCAKETYVVLNPDDIATITSKPGPGKWCTPYLLVSQTTQNYDLCDGCTLTVKFERHSIPFGGRIHLSQQSYDMGIYLMGIRPDFRDEIGIYGNGAEDIPKSIESQDTMVSIEVTDTDGKNAENLDLKVVVTPNLPKGLGAAGILGIIFSCIIITVGSCVAIIVCYAKRKARNQNLQGRRQNTVESRQFQEFVRRVTTSNDRSFDISTSSNASQRQTTVTSSASPPTYDDVVNAARDTHAVVQTSTPSLASQSEHY